MGSVVLPEVASNYGRLRHFLGGRWIEDPGESLAVMNPATAKEIAQVPLAAKEIVRAAVGAAKEASSSWRETPPLERARRFFAFRDLMIRDADVLARIISQDQGKTIEEARAEVQRAIENVEVAAGVPSLMMGYGLEDGAAKGMDEEVVAQPLGVFAGITPFNFPLMVAFWFLPYALATGNTYVLKPSEQDPVVWTRIMDLFAEAGFPPGVVNLVHGARETAEALIDHPDLQGVSFVGSTPVAKAVYARAGSRGIRAQCGGGAKNVLVVMPDARLDQTVEAVLNSAYGMAGQRCLAGSAVVAVGDAHDSFLDKFRRAAERMRLGYGLDPATDMGPVVSDAAKSRVTSFVETGESEGAELVLDGRTAKVAEYPGYFVGPTIFDGVAGNMRVAREEIFGPVLGVREVHTLDEAIEAIHESPYGNAASIFTESGAAARRFRYEVRCGNIGVNVGVAAPIAYFPFGGARESFFGVLHGQGRDAVRFFTRHKVVISRWS